MFYGCGTIKIKRLEIKSEKCETDEYSRNNSQDDICVSSSSIIVGNCVWLLKTVLNIIIKIHKYLFLSYYKQC